ISKMWSVSLAIICILTASIDLSLQQECEPNGKLCLWSEDCCSKLCIGAVCMDCKELGQPCTYNWHCCTGLCVFLHCQECGQVGAYCFYNEDCCSNWCSWFTCTENRLK
ncbi:unnamed protein product, partial [Allacma fusca]